MVRHCAHGWAGRPAAAVAWPPLFRSGGPAFRGPPYDSAGMAHPSRPTIAVTMGDPLGVGPEVVVKALADPAMRSLGRFHIYGIQDAMLAAADLLGIEPFWWRVAHDSPIANTCGVHDAVVLDFPEFAGACSAAPASPTKAGGEASFRFVDEAIASTRHPEGDPRRAAAIVTAPISKEAWALAGHKRWAGHTELLASRLGARRHAMMFVSPKLRVVLATVHIPLMAVGDALTIGRVLDAIALGAEECRAMGVETPRVAVCGLNPHAGERGLLGDEDERVIAPAIRLAREQGIEARGPLPGDTVFVAAARGNYDLVVAMYHDQGLIPVKLLGWEEAVNLTVGLPIPRTSPDHGTAFDIAGKGVADPRSMKAALALAVRLAGSPAARVSAAGG